MQRPLLTVLSVVRLLLALTAYCAAHVTSALEIQYGPWSEYAEPGDYIRLQVYPPDSALTYQWIKEGSPVGPSTNMWQFVANVSDSGTYWVRVSDGVSTIESKHVDVLVRDDRAREKWRVSAYYPWSIAAVDSNGSYYFVTYGGAPGGIRQNGELKWLLDRNSGDGGMYPPTLLRNGRFMEFGWRVRTYDRDLPTFTTYFDSPNPAGGPITYDASSDRAFLQDNQGILKCIEGTTGNLLWQKTTGIRSDANGSINQFAGRFYIPGPPKTLLALSTSSGAELWRKVFPDEIYSREPALDDNGTVYLATDHQLFALDGATGSTKWVYGDTNGLYTKTVIGNDAIFQGEGHDLVCLDYAGHVKWKYSFDPFYPGFSPALADDGTLYVCFGEFVAAIDTVTGTKKWDYLVGRNGWSDITIGTDGTIVIMASQGVNGESSGPGGDYIVALKGTSPLASAPWPKWRANYANTGSMRSTTTLPPRFVVTPRPVVVGEGQRVELTSVATGSGSISYRWRKNGVLLNVTTSTLVITSATAADSGAYDVIATSQYGSITSDKATVEVVVRPPVWLRTSAGNGAPGGNDFYPAILGELTQPTGLAFDGAGYLFVTAGHAVRFISPGGRLGTFAGSDASSGLVNGSATDARFAQPGGVAIDGNGDLLVADTGNNVIRKISRQFRTVTTLAGTGVPSFVNGSPDLAKFNHPTGLAVGADGSIYVADRDNNAIRQIKAGAVSTFAGNVTSGFADGAGADARFNKPVAVAIGQDGSLYVADSAANRIRKITPTGFVSTIAGTNIAGFQDGVGSNALLNQPSALAVGFDGRVYFTETGNHSIRAILPNGFVMTLAGSGSAGYADGVGSTALFSRPSGIAIASSGALTISDSANNRLRRTTFVQPSPDPQYGELRVELKPWITLTGEVGRQFRIEASQSLEQPIWTLISHVVLTNEVQGWMEPNVPSGAYFRAIQESP